ncbi:hypothetical protein [Pseudoxanthomonas sp. Root65]|uniref:hypothetical protein n=1 Tax=Pseudoxanthomonas sp. Root65 TaxID=1736576 RepID=UPI0012E37FC1|nr:hypothetical protein [Pseudoxanthomonas sp. Root65]
MATSRTVGPIHFEDLEPKRFEDLVRQLAYDFKVWRRLEATGRAGSDDGFDARGYEIVAVEESADNETEDEIAPQQADRLWLIQCKREKIISPKKLSTYLDQVSLKDSESLHGLIFVAACDFSKKSRDEFRQKCESLGIQEWHLWGKAELEDQLFLPKNDNLLFAYFGISLSIRRRSRKSVLGQLLATKRKAHRSLSGKTHANLLLRDASEDSYPDPPEDHKERPRWLTARFREFHARGLIFQFNRYFAYLSRDPLQWDAALSFNDAPDHHDYWSDRSDRFEVRRKIFDFWSTLPEENQAWLDVMALVPYESIIAIDELGDNYHSEPHVYVDFDQHLGPFAGYAVNISAGGRWNKFEFSPDSLGDHRTSMFPAEMRSDIDAHPYSPKRLLGP